MRSAELRCKDLAKVNGWDVYDCDPGEQVGVIQLDTPDGKMLDGDTHGRCISYDTLLDGKASRTKAWAEASAEIQRGDGGDLEPCGVLNGECYGAGCFPSHTYTADDLATMFPNGQLGKKRALRELWKLSKAGQEDAHGIPSVIRAAGVALGAEGKTCDGPDDCGCDAHLAADAAKGGA